MPAAVFTAQLLVDGVAYGLVIGLLAMGLVLTYRVSRVINFAVGNMGLVGTALCAYVWVNFGVPFWLAALTGLVVGTVFGVVVELTVIRRLFTAPRVIVLVATIGVAQLSLAVITAYPDLSDDGAIFPTAITGSLTVGSVRLSGAQLSMLVLAPLLATALAWFLHRTMLGKAIAAAAENPDLARLCTINPKVVSTAVWGLSALLATISMTLVAGLNGSAIAVASLGPSTLVRAMAAAVIARFSSISAALAAGVAIGVAQNVIAFNWLTETGLSDFVLLVAVLVAVASQSHGTRRETSTFRFAPKVAAVPEHLSSRWELSVLRLVGPIALVAIAVAVPLLVEQPSRHLLYTTIVGYAICGISTVVLTGWGGQLSLGQMAFAGIGALSAATLARGASVDIGWGSTRWIRGTVPSMPFAIAVVGGAAVAGAVAVVVGLGALRVRGLLLAVSTFAFAVAAESYLYRRPLFTGGDSRIRFERGSIFGLDLDSRRTYYFVVLVVLAALIAMVSRIRRTGPGRVIVAVRDNPDAAAAYSVRATPTSLSAFALAGSIAGLGGALIAGATERVPTTGEFFGVEQSLTLVALVVIGGISSPIGAALGALWIIGLPALFPDNELVPLFTSSLGVLVLLMYFPGGMLQIATTIRNAAVGALARRHPAPPTTRAEDRTVASTVRSVDHRSARDTTDWLSTEHVTVRFGGLVAVNDVSISVGPGAIVGLIGTNGAGKSTLMNAIGGFVPSTGTVRLMGHDISTLDAPRRVGFGLGRTFQAATLFGELTVRETVQVALEARHRSSLPATIALTPSASRRERAQRSEADELLNLLGLGRYGDHQIADLSTGTRRVVEMAAVLAVAPSVLCLDEPTAGLAQRETEAFGPLIEEISRQLGAAIILIEHDMPLVMGLSTQVYCMEAGRVIAHGTPNAIRSDPAVIASYLGTDERAIARSGASAPSHEPIKELP